MTSPDRHGQFVSFDTWSRAICHVSPHHTTRRHVPKGTNQRTQWRSRRQSKNDGYMITQMCHSLLRAMAHLGYHDFILGLLQYLGHVERTYEMVSVYLCLDKIFGMLLLARISTGDILRYRELHTVLILVIVQRFLVYLEVISQAPVHIGNVVLINLLHKGNHI